MLLQDTRRGRVYVEDERPQTGVGDHGGGEEGRHSHQFQSWILGHEQTIVSVNFLQSFH